VAAAIQDAIGDGAPGETATVHGLANVLFLAVPDAGQILGGALLIGGFGAAWAAGTLSGRAVLDLLHDVRLEGRQWFRKQATAMLDSIALPDGTFPVAREARDTVARFFGRAREYIEELVKAGVKAMAGPDEAWLDVPIVREAIREAVEGQHDYLMTFQADTLAADTPMTSRFVAQAEMYGAAAWNGTQAVHRDVAKRTNIFNFESREHFGINPKDLCKVCRDEIKKGRVPIGSLRVIGDSPCRANCHCAFNFYETLTGPEFNTIFAGRGPMSFAVFGRTG